MARRLIMIDEEDLHALFRGEILEVEKTPASQEDDQDVSLALNSFTPFQVIQTACEVASEILPKTRARRRGELQPLIPAKRTDEEIRESLRQKQFADGSFSGPFLADEDDYLERHPRSGPTELL